MEQRPGDIQVKYWKDGKDAAWDVSVISPLQTLSNIVSRSATNPGHALMVRFNQKNRLYFDACASEGITFVALPMETMGGWHPDAAQVISRLSFMVQA